MARSAAFRLNRSGLLRFKASQIGKDTALAQIIKLVEEAQASTAQVQRLADQDRKSVV